MTSDPRESTAEGAVIYFGKGGVSPVHTQYFLSRAFVGWGVQGDQPYPRKQVIVRGRSPPFAEDCWKGGL